MKRIVVSALVSALAAVTIVSTKDLRMVLQTGHTPYLYGAIFSPDGKREEGAHWIMSVRFSPDGKKFAWELPSGWIGVHDIALGKVERF